MSRPCASGWLGRRGESQRGPARAAAGQARGGRGGADADGRASGGPALLRRRRLSLADIALYAYTHVAEERRLPAWRLSERWGLAGRVAAAPGYMPMTPDLIGPAFVDDRDEPDAGRPTGARHPVRSSAPVGTPPVAVVSCTLEAAGCPGRAIEKPHRPRPSSARTPGPSPTPSRRAAPSPVSAVQGRGEGEPGADLPLARGLPSSGTRSRTGRRTRRRAASSVRAKSAAGRRAAPPSASCRSSSAIISFFMAPPFPNGCIRNRPGKAPGRRRG